MYSVSDETRKPIFEGVQGENESREIQFDISPWIEELGEGVCTATAKRPTDTTPYPVTVTRSGNVVTWKPNSTDTSIEGIGAFQLSFSIDSVVAKTRIWNTKVAPSLVGAGDPPDPYDDWIGDLREIAADAIQSADDAQDSADAAAASASQCSGLKNDLSNLTNQLVNATGCGFFADDFELGNIGISSSGWTYSSSTTRVRTKQGTTLRLKEGDVIGLTSYSNARYYVGWLSDGGAYAYLGWLTEDLTIYADGEYVILLCNAVDTVLSDKNDLLDLFFVKRHTARRSIYNIPWFNSRGMRLHAHRGLIDGVQTSDYVENSIPAFELAGQKQMFICETDVHVTSDGHFVCIHNDTVDQTTNGAGTVSNMTLAQIRALRLLKKNGEASDLLVPTFEEYLAICKKYNMVAAFEIKNYPGTVGSALMSIVKKYGMESQSYIISSYVYIHSIRMRLLIDLPVFLVAASSTWADSYNMALKYDNVGITFYSGDTLTKEMVENCHDNGIPVDVWTANTKANADNYFDLGVDIVTTDILSPSDWLTV